MWNNTIPLSFVWTLYTQKSLLKSLIIELQYKPPNPRMNPEVAQKRDKCKDRSLVEQKCAPIDLQVLLFCSTGFTVWLLVGIMQHQPSEQGGEIHNAGLDEFAHYLLFISADFCPRLGMNTFFPVKSWESFCAVSTEPFSAMRHWITVRRQAPCQEMSLLKMVYLFLPKDILLRGEVDIKSLCFI